MKPLKPATDYAVGDLVIIAAFVQVPEGQVASFKPRLVFFDEANGRLAHAVACPAQHAVRFFEI